MDALVRHGVISEADRDLLTFCDSVDEAFDVIVAFLEENYGPSLLLGE